MTDRGQTAEQRMKRALRIVIASAVLAPLLIVGRVLYVVTHTVAKFW